MTAVPSQISDSARAHIERVRDLAEYALAADTANTEDLRQWYRVMLRAVTDMTEEAQEVQRDLSYSADDLRILTPTEIAELSKITRAAIYHRRKK